MDLRRAARIVTQQFDHSLQPTGLKATQFSVLSTLYQAKGPLSVNELADALTADRTTVTRNLKPLETAGYLASKTDGDRRRRMVALTEDGHAKLAEAIPHWEAAQRDMVKRIGKKDWRAMRALLRDVVANAG
ncbi:MAG: MarR family winged helix-turn-helix transcriptional regulator [Alphaproteobacteria bacterium]